MIKVLVTLARSKEKQDRFRSFLEREIKSLEGLDLAFTRTDADQIEMIADREVFLGDVITPAVFRAAPALRWIHLVVAGVERSLFPELVKSDVVLTNSQGMHGAHMAEHALALMLAFARCLPDCARYQARHEWGQRDVVKRNFTLSGKSALIVGLGGVGQAIAIRLLALGMSVRATRFDPGKPSPMGVKVYEQEQLPDVVAEADFVIISVPLTEATRNLVSREVIGQMRRGAYLINVARGAVVDETAMVDALRNGHLAGAGLDVFSEEPLPPESPLWDLPSVVLTPHSSGNYPGYVEQATEIFAQNLLRFQRGEPLQNVVDKRRGY